MSVALKDFKLSYYSVPKVACTSIKHLLFEVENGFEFRPFRVQGVLKHIHNFYGSKEFVHCQRNDFPDNYRFAVVRDPIERLLSAYSNRVLFHFELSPKRLKDARAPETLPATPDLGTFVDRLEEYRRFSYSIEHHTQPMTFFIGNNPDYYDRVYKLSELGQLEEWLSERLGRTLTLRREQVSAKKFSVSDLSPHHVRRLRNIFEQDYSAYGRFF